MKTIPHSLATTTRARGPAALRPEGWAALALAAAVGLTPATAQEPRPAPRQAAAPAAPEASPAAPASEPASEPAPTGQAAPAPLSIALSGVLGAKPPVGAPAPAVIPLAASLVAGAAAAPAAPTSGAIVLPGPRIATATAAAPAPAAGPAAPQPPAAAAQTPLGGIWPLDISRVADGRAQFRGERDSLEFALVVAPGATPRELTIAAVSSAFILPSRSTLRVFAGDTLIGESPLRSITGLETLAFPLQPGVLAPGLNRIRIEVELAHRLYCGALPSYDLWTRVDLGRSGVAYDPAATPAGPEAFLAAANAARAEGQPILVRPGTQGAAPEAAEVSRQLGRILGGGLTFAVGARPAGAGEAASPVVELVDGGPAGARFRKDPDGAQVLEVGAENGVVPQLFAADAAAATADPAPLLSPDTPVPLNRLGFSTVRIAQHLWTRDVPFVLPTDWLMNVRERAVLNLGYAYLPGMPTGAELRVLVNGAVVRIIPLDRGGRQDPAPLEVRFDAGLLQAGRNILGFETFVPGDPGDRPCLTAAVDRIEIRDTSTLIVPGTPRMHVPGIPHWMAGGGAMGVEAAANAVLGAEDDAQAAMHLNLAAALHGAGADDPSEPPRRLVVLRPTDLSSAVFGDFGMGRQAMLATLQRPGPGAPGSAPTAAGPGAAQPAPGLPVGQPAPGFGAAQAATGGADAPLTFTVERTGYVDRAVDAARALGHAAWMAVGRLALPDPVADLGDWLSRQRGQAILFQLDKAAPDDLHLLLSDDADADAVLTGLGRAAERGAPLEGHVAVLGWDGKWTAWTDDTRLPVLEEDLNGRNWRGVVGNFASAQPRIFVGLLVGIALLSVLAANSYLAASRRQR